MEFVHDKYPYKNLACVYKIDIDKKYIYIGSTNHFSRRIHQHRSRMKSGQSNTFINAVIKESSVIEFTIIEKIDDLSILREREEYHIQKNMSKDNLLNMFMASYRTMYVSSPEYLKLANGADDFFKNHISNHYKTMKGKPIVKRIVTTADLEKKVQGAKPIYQYTPSGDFLMRFNSIKVAARYLELIPSSIRAVANGRYRDSGGFVFKFQETSKEEIVAQFNNKK